MTARKMNTVRSTVNAADAPGERAIRAASFRQTEPEPQIELRRGEIPTALDELDCAIATAQGLVAILSEKLGPVLRPQQDMGCGVVDAEVPFDSPAALAVWRATEAVRGITVRIDDLLHRAEL